jgi:hypothetical protein
MTTIFRQQYAPATSQHLGPAPPRPVRRTPPPPGPDLAIYETQAILVDRRRWEPLAGLVVGDLAVLPDGRLFARRVIQMADGSGAYAYEQWDLERDVEQPWGAGTDWLYRLESTINHTGGLDSYHILGPPERSSNDKLCDEYPELAADLGKHRDAPPPRLFDVGTTVRYPKLLVRQSGSTVSQGPDYWRDIVVGAHANGIFGLHGAIDDVPPLTPVMRWTAAELPIATQNALAIADRTGAVRSRHLLPGGIEKSLPHHPGYPDRVWVVDVLTVIRTSRSFTLATVVEFDPPSAP